MDIPLGPTHPHVTTIPYWNTLQVLEWSQRLLDSYHYWLGQELVERLGGIEKQAERLFQAPFVVVSHGTQEDPVLNYGNRVALELWEMDWSQFTATRSRLTAEPMNQKERARMLHHAANQGYIRDYQGVRISSTGRRFWVERAIVWTVLNKWRMPCGQAATFSIWKYLDKDE